MSRPDHLTERADRTDQSEKSALLASFLASRSDADRAALIEAYRPLIAISVRSFLRRLPPGIGEEELISAGHLGLIRAIGRYDPSRGTALESWVVTCVRCAIRSEMSSMVEASRRTEQSDPSEFEEITGQLPDTSPGPLAQLLATERKRLLTAAVARLPARRRQVITRHFHDGLSFREIGLEMGISACRVRQLEQEALATLGQVLNLDRAYFVAETEVPASPALPRTAGAGSGTAGNPHA